MIQKYSDIDLDIQHLMDELADGTLSKSQWKVLQEYIRCDPAVKAAYIEFINFEALIHREFTGVISVTNTPEEPVADVNRSVINKFWKPVAVGAAALLALGVYLTPENTPSKASSEVKITAHAPKSFVSIVDSAVARVTASEKASWVGKNSKIAVGTWLKPGNYELEKGNAEITFDSGAVVTITPHTVFEIVDSNMAYLHVGKVSSYVPESAIGFRIQTPEGNIEDLGTRFGLSVNPNGSTDVHVLEGIVEASNSKSSDPATVVTARQAMRLQRDKAPSRVDYLGENYTVSLKSKVGRISSSYIHYSFDDLEDGRQAADETGIHQDGQAYPAQIITPKKASPTWSPSNGRFGQAMYLTGDSTYLRAKYRKIQGNSARTMAFWVKIPPNTTTNHAYSFAAWGPPRTQQGEKWQVGWNPNYRNNCGVEGAIRTEFGKGYVTGSTDLRDGRWHHVASVFLGDNGQHISSQIRHYVDGKLERVSGYNDEDSQINTSVQYKPLIIGRYLDYHHPVFKGMKAWMDEFYLFESALTPDQIQQLYLSNTPPKHDEYLPSLFLDL